MGKSRWKIRDLLADERCSRAVLDILSTTDVGRLIPAPAGEDAQSEASEWELRKRRESEEERRAEAEGLAPSSRKPCYYPRPPSWHPRKRSENVLSFICYSFGPSSIFLGQAWAEVKGKLATCRHSGGERVKKYTATV
jgi:hypothetical protein